MGEFLQAKENQTLLLVIPGPQIACRTPSGQAGAKFKKNRS